MVQASRHAPVWQQQLILRNIHWGDIFVFDIIMKWWSNLHSHLINLITEPGAWRKNTTSDYSYRTDAIRLGCSMYSSCCLVINCCTFWFLSPFVQVFLCVCVCFIRKSVKATIQMESEEKVFLFSSALVPAQTKLVPERNSSRFIWYGLHVSKASHSNHKQR